MSGTVNDRIKALMPGGEWNTVDNQWAVEGAVVKLTSAGVPLELAIEVVSTVVLATVRDMKERANEPDNYAAQMGVEVVDLNRASKITVHGP